eukprot:tig00020816_g14133.t1
MQAGPYRRPGSAPVRPTGPSPVDLQALVVQGGKADAPVPSAPPSSLSGVRHNAFLRLRSPELVQPPTVQPVARPHKTGRPQSATAGYAGATYTNNAYTATNGGLPGNALRAIPRPQSAAYRPVPLVAPVPLSPAATHALRPGTATKGRRTPVSALYNFSHPVDVATLAHDRAAPSPGDHYGFDAGSPRVAMGRFYTVVDDPPLRAGSRKRSSLGAAAAGGGAAAGTLPSASSAPATSGPGAAAASRQAAHASFKSQAVQLELELAERLSSIEDGSLRDRLAVHRQFFEEVIAREPMHAGLLAKIKAEYETALYLPRDSLRLEIHGDFARLQEELLLLRAEHARGQEELRRTRDEAARLQSAAAHEAAAAGPPWHLPTPAPAAHVRPAHARVRVSQARLLRASHSGSRLAADPSGGWQRAPVECGAQTEVTGEGLEADARAARERCRDLEEAVALLQRELADRRDREAELASELDRYVEAAGGRRPPPPRPASAMGGGGGGTARYSESGTARSELSETIDFSLPESQRRREPPRPVVVPPLPLATIDAEGEEEDGEDEEEATDGYTPAQDDYSPGPGDYPPMEEPYAGAYAELAAGGPDPHGPALVDVAAAGSAFFASTDRWREALEMGSPGAHPAPDFGDEEGDVEEEDDGDGGFSTGRPAALPHSASGGSRRPARPTTAAPRSRPGTGEGPGPRIGSGLRGVDVSSSVVYDEELEG